MKIKLVRGIDAAAQILKISEHTTRKFVHAIPYISVRGWKYVFKLSDLTAFKDTTAYKFTCWVNSLQPKPITQKDGAVSITRASKILSIGPCTIHKLIRTGALKSEKLASGRTRSFITLNEIICCVDFKQNTYCAWWHENRTSNPVSSVR